MKNRNIIIVIILGIILGVVLNSCKKEHSEYRHTPTYKVGDLVQYEKSIEHDYFDERTGKRMWDIPQPLVIDSFYYNATWRDNWYYMHSQSTGEVQPTADELSLQKWNGHLQK